MSLGQGTIRDCRWGAQWLAHLLPDSAALGSIPSIPQKNSWDEIVHAADVNQRRWLEESEQWLENVDQWNGN